MVLACPKWIVSSNGTSLLHNGVNYHVKNAFQAQAPGVKNFAKKLENLQLLCLEVEWKDLLFFLKCL
jgi:hypothetical protein